MSEEFKNNEIVSIEQLIMLLARRKYILKSELEHILRGCRNNSFRLIDIENIMKQCVASDIEYIDDSKDVRLVQLSIELHQELLKSNFDDLFSYLEISHEATEEEILQAIKKKRNSTIENLACELVEDDNMKTYELVVSTWKIVEELQLRQRYNISLLHSVEYDNYLNDIILMTFVEKTVARNLLNGYIKQMSFSVERDFVKAIESNKGMDKYMVFTEESQSEKDGMDSQKDINENRGVNNGRH